MKTEDLKRKIFAGWRTFFNYPSVRESVAEVLPFHVIKGRLKVVVMTVIYGLLIFCLSLLAYIILKLLGKRAVA